MCFINELSDQNKAFECSLSTVLKLSTTQVLTLTGNKLLVSCSRLALVCWSSGWRNLLLWYDVGRTFQYRARIFCSDLMQLVVREGFIAFRNLENFKFSSRVCAAQRARKERMWGCRWLISTRDPWVILITFYTGVQMKAGPALKDLQSHQ
jgi:hypothetical protein